MYVYVYVCIYIVCVCVDMCILRGCYTQTCQYRLAQKVPHFIPWFITYFLNAPGTRPTHHLEDIKQWLSRNGGCPIAGWFIMETPMKTS